jgi:hypothetical protein
MKSLGYPNKGDILNDHLKFARTSKNILKSGVSLYRMILISGFDCNIPLYECNFSSERKRVYNEDRAFSKNQRP